MLRTAAGLWAIRDAGRVRATTSDDLGRLAGTAIAVSAVAGENGLMQRQARLDRLRIGYVHGLGA
jgi:hypothetical protein